MTDISVNAKAILQYMQENNLDFMPEKTKVMNIMSCDEAEYKRLNKELLGLNIIVKRHTKGTLMGTFYKLNI